MKAKNNKLIIRLSVLALLVLTAVTFVFTYAWFIDREEAEGTITFGRVDIEIAYTTWTGLNLVPGDKFFASTPAATDLTVKLNSASETIYLILVPNLTWALKTGATLPVGVTEAAATDAMATLKGLILANFETFGSAGHLFGLSVEITDLGGVAYVYTGSAATPTDPAVFTSTSPVTVVSINNLTVPTAAGDQQARVNGVIIQDLYECKFTLELRAIQSRNLTATTAAGICELAGYTLPTPPEP